MATRVLLAGGGSGGSAAPVIAVAEALRRDLPEVELLYVGTESGPERALAKAAALPYVSVHAGRFPRYLTWRHLTEPFHVMAGLAQAYQLVRRFRPHAAFGAGGFATVPPLMAARLLGVPVAVHQQDVIVGLANRILGPFATRLTVAFAASRATGPWKGARVVGNPVRRAVREADTMIGRDRLGLAEVPVVLVTGGGTGARRLNEIAAAAAHDVVAFAHVVHVTGAGRGVPGPDHPHYQQHEFLTDGMADALAAADIVVSRAGMSALSEIAALRKPSIVVPMPASHQEANAQVLRAAGAAIVWNESALTPVDLTAELRRLLADSEARRRLGEAAAVALATDGGERIAAEIEQILS